MSKRRFLIAAAVAIPVVAIVALSTRSGGVDPYPTTPEGWNARLDDHLADIGAARGENWDLWLDVSAELERMLEDPDSVTDEQLAAMLDRLVGVERFTPAYDLYPASDPNHFDSITPARKAYRDLLAPRIRDSIRNQQGELAAAWINRADALCGPLRGSALMVDALVHMAIAGAMLDDLSTAVSNTRAADPASLGPIQAAIQRATPPDPSRVFAAEREWGLPLIADSARAGWPVQARSQIRDFDELMTDAAAAKTDPAALPRIQAYRDKLATEPAFARRRVSLDMMLPAVSNLWAHADALATQRNGTALLIALARHRATHGQYPATLDDLDPAILSPLPEDPYAPDKRFVYRVLDATAERPIDAILLYSIGADGRDDGGQHNPKSKPLVLGGSGDFVFTRPPEPESPPADGDSEDAASEPEDQP